jgi:hypothetical protein
VNDLLDNANALDIHWEAPSDAPKSLHVDTVLVGDQTDALEIVIASSQGKPKADDMRRLWRARWGMRAAPVALVVRYESVHGDRAAACGLREDAEVVFNLDVEQVERVGIAAFNSPTVSEGERLLQKLFLESPEGQIAGLTNTGLFASHELRVGVPQRPDWQDKRTLGRYLMAHQGLNLLSELGYGIAPYRSAGFLLSSNDGPRRAVAVLVEDSEHFDRPSSRLHADSPVLYGLSMAQQHELPWLLLLRGTQLRLYSAKPQVGVGRKGQTETYVELDFALLDEDSVGYLPLLFHADALAPSGSVDEILEASANHVAALGARLRERIYTEAVPELAVAVASRMEAKSEDDLGEAYHRTLIILFRLLFVAYAEDRGLLPYARNPRYTRKALKTLAREFVESPGDSFDTNATDLWNDLLSVWRAINNGNEEWDVPAYNGGLFADDERHPSGQSISRMEFTNDEIGPALRALLVDTSEDGMFGPVDFRSLSVREFGTIYEGLLESSLSIAPTNLTLANDKSFIPAKEGRKAEIKAGQVYFHNASGKRKATGSYFTKSFAVEHLLDTSLEPALTQHLDKLHTLIDQDEEAKAAEAFFDFRVADLAMGSGHFLVAAIDRIERRLAAFLTEHRLSAVAEELDRLAQTARDALGSQAGHVEIETSMLLRRQIARRCIYGLDLNTMAVELARLGIWIHTFVPGLPMSALDHGLVAGNSLTGMATIDQVLDVLDANRAPGQVSLFAEQIETTLEKARTRLLRVGRTAEATKQEVHAARDAHAQALHEAQDVKALLDAAVAAQMGAIALPMDPEQAIARGKSEEARKAVAAVRATHLLYQYPEVFLRPEGGFDVILGNPPWEKVRWEAAPYWVGVSPGLMALTDKAREKKIEELRVERPLEAGREQQDREEREILQGLFKKAYTLRGGTHLELAQLMLERALRSLSHRGHLGLVLPRQSMVLAGWKKLRGHLVGSYDLSIVQGRNHGEWIFEEVHASYAVVLLSVRPRTERTIEVGVARTPEEVAAVTAGRSISFTSEELGDLSDANVVPWFNEPEDRKVFDIMRVFPRISSGQGWIRAWHDARWDFTGSGRDKRLATADRVPGAWKVLMTRHVDAFTFDDEPYKQFVTDLRPLSELRRGVALIEGAFTLSASHPLLIFRRPSRSNDSRTLIATALPETGYLPNNGSVHAIMHSLKASPSARLALVGLMNTLTMDWWVRRFVDRHVTSPIINQLRLPDWGYEDIAAAGTITGSLLSRSGSTRLAGGIDVTDLHKGTEAVELLAELERLTLRGFGLRHQELEVIAQDFNETGLPSELRTALNLRKGTAQ